MPQKAAEGRGRDAHAGQVQQCGRRAEQPDGQKFAPDNLLPAGWADEQSFHRTALFFPCAEVHRRIERPRQRPHDEHERENPHQQIEHSLRGPIISILRFAHVTDFKDVIEVGRQAVPEHAHFAELMLPLRKDAGQAPGGEPRMLLLVAVGNLEHGASIRLKPVFEVRGHR